MSSLQLVRIDLDTSWVARRDEALLFALTGGYRDGSMGADGIEAMR
jgi:hypothetical protein